MPTVIKSLVIGCTLGYLLNIPNIKYLDILQYQLGFIAVQYITYNLLEKYIIKRWLIWNLNKKKH